MSNSDTLHALLRRSGLNGKRTERGGFALILVLMFAGAAGVIAVAMLQIAPITRSAVWHPIAPVLPATPRTA